MVGCCVVQMCVGAVGEIRKPSLRLFYRRLFAMRSGLQVLDVVPRPHFVCSAITCVSPLLSRCFA
jgi:hypothetical protein